MAKISAAKADSVLTGNWSNDLLLLMKASKSAGLAVRFSTVFLDQPGNLATPGTSRVASFVAATFNAEAGGAEGERFVDAYKAEDRPRAGLHRTAGRVRHGDGGRRPGAGPARGAAR